MLKQYITSLVSNYNGSYKHVKDGLFKKNFGINAYNQVLQATTFLPEDSPFSLRARCVVDNITTHPTCKMCNNNVVFNSTKGWLTYCSNDCRFKDYDHIQEKKRITNLERYGATNILASKQVLDARKQTDAVSSKSIKTPEAETDAIYLNETNLGKFIAANITENFLRDRPIPDSNSIKRFDYIMPELKLIVEFDGDSHYTSAKAIANDIEKEKLAQSLNYRVIRIPYFIQLDDTMIKHYFGEYITGEVIRFIFNDYPHGFIDAKARTPGDFCELGQKRFMHTWQTLPTSVMMQLSVNLKNIADTSTAEVVLFTDIVTQLTTQKF